jgi:ABC-type spermidine/putrescine transport system permease subunit I
MQISNRSMAACLAFAITLIFVKVAVPPSPAQSSGSTAASLAIAFIVLVVSLVAAYWLSKSITLKSPSLSKFVSYCFLATIPIGVATCGAVTGWIRIFGRAGRFSDYSVAASPVGFWVTFVIYVALATIPLSWALACYRLRSADKEKR